MAHQHCSDERPAQASRLVRISIGGGQVEVANSHPKNPSISLGKRKDFQVQMERMNHVKLCAGLKCLHATQAGIRTCPAMIVLYCRCLPGNTVMADLNACDASRQHEDMQTSLK